MHFHPGILALHTGSVLMAAMVIFSCYQGALIIRHWNIDSGSEYQLQLERKTYLVSTIMGYVLGFQLLSLFLFIYTADAISHLLIGAMCAAGSLNANAFGYPTLILKILNCILAGVWIILNRADNRAFDYPLIRKKYQLLLGIAPLLILETVLQILYLGNLNPDIITSCCSLIFSDNGNRIVSDLLSIPPDVSMAALYGLGVLLVLSGIRVYRKNRGAIFLAALSVLFIVDAIIALLSFISIYVYELPTHHCPFCLLQQEYSYIGYLLYSTMLLCGISGIGVGVLHPFRKIPSLQEIIPDMQRRLALCSAICVSLYMLVAGYGVITSNLIM